MKNCERGAFQINGLEATGSVFKLNSMATAELYQQKEIASDKMLEEIRHSLMHKKCKLVSCPSECLAEMECKSNALKSYIG